MRKWRIVLADDHVVLRDGLAALINMQGDMEVVGHANDGLQVMQEVANRQPDVVVLDVSMPVMNGVQATAQMQQLVPPPQIVALTRHSEAAYVRQLLQAGARGYVLKQSAAEQLIAAIRAVANGNTYLDTSLTDRAINHFVNTHTRAVDATSAELSDREADVAKLTAYGYSNKEIATQLGISVKTVDTYKARAMEKLGLHSRSAIVRYALQRGWLDEM